MTGHRDRRQRPDAHASAASPRSTHHLRRRAGEVFGFLGANGAGKTTAIRMLTALLAPTSGRRDGRGLRRRRRRPSRSKRGIGYMSQRFSLYEDLTVRENITLYGGIYGLSDARDRRPHRRACSTRLGLEHAGDELVRDDPARLEAEARLLAWRCCTGRASSSSTSRPAASIPITRRQFWELIYEAARARARPCSSPRTTWTRRSTATGSRSWSTGAIAAMGTPAELEASSSAPSRWTRCSSGSRGRAERRARERRSSGFVRKEMLHILRDRRTLAVLILLAGGAGDPLRLRDPHRRRRHAPRDRRPDAGLATTGASRSGSPPSDVFRIVASCRSAAALDRSSGAGRSAGARVQPGFARRLARGDCPPGS